MDNQVFHPILEIKLTMKNANVIFKYNTLAEIALAILIILLSDEKI